MGKYSEKSGNNGLKGSVTCGYSGKTTMISALNKLKEAYKIAKTEDVSTPPNSVVLYSISYLPTRENKDKAMAYLYEHKECYTLDDTLCGKKLIALGLETGNGCPDSEILKVWALASKRFIAATSGNVVAFVSRADLRSTFVSVELPHILQNENIEQINGEDKFVFAKQFNL